MAKGNGPRFINIAQLDRMKRKVLGLPLEIISGAPTPYGYYKDPEHPGLYMPDIDRLRTLYLSIQMLGEHRIEDVIKWLHAAGIPMDRRNYFRWMKDSPPVKEIMLPYLERLACYICTRSLTVDSTPEEVAKHLSVPKRVKTKYKLKKRKATPKTSKRSIDIPA